MQLFIQFKNFRLFIKVKLCRILRRPPATILFPVIWITNKCNLHCKMCDQWKSDPERLSPELSTGDWFSFVDSAMRMHTAVVVITGGEPLLREDIFEIIKYIHKKGICSHLCTNGTLLNEIYVDRLKATGINSISISLDSYCAKIHNQLRGVDCFDTVVKGIKLLRKTTPELKIGINYVITKQNFRNLDRMIPFAESLKVNQIKFDPIHTNLMQRKKPLSSFADLIFYQEDLPELKEEVNKLIKLAAQSKLLTNSRIFMKGISNFPNKAKTPRLSCYAGYISCAIDALGWVSPCDNFEGNDNLRSKSLEEIWNSQSFQQLRQRVINCHGECWDTTHSELNIRCSQAGFIREFGHILKEIYFYLTP